MNLGNSITLIGNLGNEFEVKNLGNGRTLAKTSLATNETYKSKDGEMVKKTQWHNLVVWGKKAEIISKYTKKGSRLAVSGKVEYDQYEDSEGKKRTATKVIVDEFQFLDKKSEAEAPF